MSHWIKEFGRDKCQTFICSDCKTRVYYIDSWSRGKYPKKSICRYTYCPWCKAKMEIEEHTVMVNMEVKVSP